VVLVEHLAERGVDVPPGLLDASGRDLADALAETIGAERLADENDPPEILATGRFPKRMAMDPAGPELVGELNAFPSKS
jgi:hypothetical protein